MRVYTNTKALAKVSPELTRMAKRFFGDELVVQAYLVKNLYYTFEDELKEVKEEFLATDWEIDEHSHHLNFDGYDLAMVIEFVSGKLVGFDASESGWLFSQNKTDLTFL